MPVAAHGRRGPIQKWDRPRLSAPNMVITANLSEAAYRPTDEQSTDGPAT